MKFFTSLSLLSILCVAGINAQPYQLRGGIIISEFLTDPTIGTDPVTGFDTNNNGVYSQDDEFVEIYNMSSEAISLNGLELYDDAGQRKVFLDTMLEAGAYAVVVASIQDGGSLPAVTGNNLAFESIEGTLGLKNSDGLIYLYDPDASEYLVISYGAGDTDPVPIEATDLTNLGTEDAGAIEEGYSLVRTTPASATFGVYNVVCNCDDFASPGAPSYTSNTYSPDLSISDTKIYPNPVVDMINIESREIIKEVKIYSVSGQMINHFYVDNENIALNLSHLAKGFYILSCADDENNVSIQKLQKL